MLKLEEASKAKPLIEGACMTGVLDKCPTPH